MGGTLFRPQQLAVLGSIVGEDARIEMTTFKQLYVEMDEERAEEAKAKLVAAGLQVHPAGFVSKSLITCNFCQEQRIRAWMLQLCWMKLYPIIRYPIP